MKTMYSNRRKGQSAIEYLTTYGWMLLVVAIVGGAIFTTVQNQSQLSSTSGFSGADIGVDTFGTNSTGVALQVISQGSSPVTVTNATLEDEEGNVAYAPSGTSTGPIPLGETRAVLVSEGAEISQSDSSNTLDVTLTYDIGDLSGLTESGTLSGNLALGSN